jgi:hypothetical protein
MVVDVEETLKAENYICNLPDTFFSEFPPMAVGTNHVHAMQTAHSKRK